MHPLVRRFLNLPRQPTREDTQALEDILRQVQSGKDRGPQDAHAAVKDNLLTVHGYERVLQLEEDTTSCGLLLTRNGYALTTLHGLAGNRRNRIGVKGKKHDATVCVVNRDFDIALVKIDLEGPAQAVPHKFHEPCTTNVRVPVRLYAHKDGPVERFGTLVTTIGMVRGKGAWSQNLFYTDAKSEPGLSGGIYTLADGSILGLHIRRLIGGTGTTGTKIGAGLSLVATYRAHLAKKYGI